MLSLSLFLTEHNAMKEHCGADV